MIKEEWMWFFGPGDECERRPVELSKDTLPATYAITLPFSDEDLQWFLQPLDTTPRTFRERRWVYGLLGRGSLKRYEYLYSE